MYLVDLREHSYGNAVGLQNVVTLQLLLWNKYSVLLIIPSSLSSPPPPTVTLHLPSPVPLHPPSPFTFPLLSPSTHRHPSPFLSSPPPPTITLLLPPAVPLHRPLLLSYSFSSTTSNTLSSTHCLKLSMCVWRAWDLELMRGCGEYLHVLTNLWAYMYLCMICNCLFILCTHPTLHLSNSHCSCTHAGRSQATSNPVSRPVCC